jgi:hypothetical protein
MFMGLRLFVCGFNLFVVQLELFPWEVLSKEQIANLCGLIRREYWVLRNCRPGYNSARRRRAYRKVAEHKKSLLMAGFSKRELLDFLACCRSGCGAKKCLYCAA